MDEENKPLSALVAQGWEIINYSSSSEGGYITHSVLLRRQKQHRILNIRPKVMGQGCVVKEMEV